MKRNLRTWLVNEVELWVAEGLIRREQADAIRARYPEPPPGAPWAVILFAGLGAVMFGLGVILILAFNWEKIHKFGKMGLILGALLAAHAGGLALRREASRWRGLGEALHLLGTMLFGSGIWLVAQIYHINEHWPNAVLVWALGALALAWALPSVAQGAVAVILLCVWTGGECCGFNTGVQVAPLLLLLGVGLLAWRERSLLLLVMSVPAYLLTLGFCLGPHHGNWIVPVILATSAALVAGGELAPRSRWFPEAGPILRFFGMGVYIVAAFTFTFEDAEREYLRHLNWNTDAGMWHWFVASAVAILLWGWALTRVSRERGWRHLLPDRADLVLTPLFFAVVAVLVPTVSSALDATFLDSDVGWIVGVCFINLLFLTQTILNLHIGCRDSRAGIAFLGSLMLAAWTLGRYTDLFHTLWVRGIVFVALGAVLFLVGLRYARNKQRRQAPGPAAPATVPAADK